MTLAILYSFRRCPYAMRARMALAYARCNVWVREILLKNKPIAMLEASPKGTVPVLVLPDDTVIDESIAIMHWALSQSDPDIWLSPDNIKLIDQLISRNDNDFKPLLDGYKYSAAKSHALSLDFRDKALPILQDLDNRLAHNKYLVSNKQSLADFAIMPFIRQFHMVDESWLIQAGLHHLHQWLQHLLKHPLFTTIMTKYPLWQQDSPDTIKLF